jgi:hypothetical protein
VCAATQPRQRCINRPHRAAGRLQQALCFLQEPLALSLRGLGARLRVEAPDNPGVE